MLPALTHGNVRLEPLAEPHREPLRAAWRADTAIQAVWSVDMDGPGFDRWFDGVLQPDASWRMWAILVAGAVASMTGLSPDPKHPGVVEVGATFLHPAHRGGPVNRLVKRLALGHLFESGAHRAEFRVDARNARSQAAVLKLGATREGVLRRHKITYGGFIRDTLVFSILDTEWLALEARLRPDG